MRRSPWSNQLPSPLPEPALRDWLTEPGSLTARCLRCCQVFKVRVLRQSMQTAPFDSRRQQLPVREVLLECDGVPVIFALSTLSTTRGGRLGRWFSNLGGRSLGSLLFTYPGFHRSKIEYARIDRHHPLFRRVFVHSPGGSCFWARRSRHSLGPVSVLVTEVFLPAVTSIKDLSMCNGL